MKCRRTILFVLCSILLALSFSSCTQEVCYVDDEVDDSPLVIYISKTSNFFLRQNIEKYNSIGVDKKIEIVEFDDAELEDMCHKMANEIAAGKGPDLICINQMTEQHLDIHKMADQGVFADLDILIENCKSFNKDKLNGTVIDAGIINGTRVIMPLSYTVDYLISSRQSFDKNGLEMPDSLTIDNYLSLIEQYYSAKLGTPFSTGSFQCSISNYILDLFLEDNTLKKTDKLKKVMEHIKKDYSLWQKDEFKTSSYDAFKKVYFENDILFRDAQVYGSQFRAFYNYYNIFNDYERGDVVFFYPPRKDNEVYSQVASSIAININSNKKNRAFKFIEFLLLDQVQSDLRCNYNLPVSNRAFEKEKTTFSSGHYIYYDDKNRVPVPKEIVQKYIEFIENVDTCKFRGRESYIFENLIRGEFMDYLEDNIDYDTFVDNVNNKLTLYYSE